MNPGIVRAPVRAAKRIVFYIALIPGCLALLFGAWLFWPVSKQMKPSYEKIAAPAAAAAKTSPAKSKVVATSPEKSETIAPSSSPISFIAERACQGKLVKLAHRAIRAPEGECLVGGLSIETMLQQALEHKKALGIRADLDNCIITDATGQYTDLGNATSDLSAITRLMIRNGGSIPHDDETQARFERVMTVGICSLQKTLEYWSEHPTEIPSPDDLPSSIYFNPATGKPERSRAIDLFLRVTTWALEKRLASQSS